MLLRIFNRYYMRKATRTFLKIRPTATHILNVELRQHPESEKNQCFFNAYEEAKRNKSLVVPGWIVGPIFYNDQGEPSTPIFWHFFNQCNNTGQYYDTSPLGCIKGTLEYISDSDVYYAMREKGLLCFEMTNNRIRARIGEPGEDSYVYNKDIPIKPITIKNMISIAKAYYEWKG